MTSATHIQSQADILIVDDTPVNLTVLSTMLSDNGYRVRPAISGELALKAARKSLPDLILLDIRMPGMDGIAVCKALKADKLTCDIPVIFISALDDIADKVSAFQVGGVDYITKPFHFEEVLARVQSQLTLLYQRQQIIALSALKDQLLRMAAHDLKNPLQVIIGYADFLLNNIDLNSDPDKIQEYITRIAKSASHMQSLITDLLDLTHIEDGLQLATEALSLDSFLHEQISEFTLLAEQKRIALHYTRPADDLVVLADPHRLAQVVNNLVANAMKYTLEGGTVTITAARQDNRCAIQVADTGLGIPAEDLPHIFDRFYRGRSKAHQAVEGTGLGLSIAKAIVDQHGGQLSVESTPGQGSTFSVILPVN